MRPNEFSITEAAKKLAAKEISAEELAGACLAEIEKRNKNLNAYLEVFDDVKEQARAADARRAKGESNPLLGIPIAVKDNILIEGRRASAASKILENYVATYDATVTKKLKDAGATFLGRANCDEFAMGGSNENSAFGPVKNPYDESRVAGGSSGGSAAAVAAHLALGALGSDTGGSTRDPASFCGVVALKPTYGAVSRSGLIAMGSSLDQIGPIAKTVEDAELVFNAIRGRDELDSTSQDFQGSNQGSTLDQNSSRSNLQGRTLKKIGVPRHLLGDGMDADVLMQFEESLKNLKEKNFETVDIELPSASLTLAIYYIIMPAEASTNLARFDGVRYGLSLRGENLWDDYAKTRGEGFGAEVRRRIMLGTYVLSAGYYEAYYGKATAARARLRKEFEDALKTVDCIATPTMPTPAWKIGEKSDPLSMYLADIFTVAANLTGNPAISVPMGTVRRGDKELPVGIQFTAAHEDEGALFAVGKVFEAK